MKKKLYRGLSKEKLFKLVFNNYINCKSISNVRYPSQILNNLNISYNDYRQYNNMIEAFDTSYLRYEWYRVIEHPQLIEEFIEIAIAYQVKLTDYQKNFIILS